MKPLTLTPAFALTVACSIGSAQAAPTTYTDLAAFLTDLGALSLTVAHEGFESTAAWGHVRSTVLDGFVSAPSVSNLGLTWSANNLTSEVTTGNGAARTGEWGFYAYPHGSYASPDPGADCSVPGACGDGWRGVADAGVLYAIGGWVRTNTPFAKIGLFIETYAGDPEGGLIDLTIGTAEQFVGVVDPEGFAAFEFRELEGTSEDRKFIFGDDFYFAGSDITAVPLPPTLGLLAAALGALAARRGRSGPRTRTQGTVTH